MGGEDNGFGFSLSIHGFLVEKWNFPTEGAGVPPVSVHNMFHLLLLFWKCNYLRYRGLNGDSLAGERFHLPKASFLVAFPFFLPQVAPPHHHHHLPGRKQSGFLLTGSIALLAKKPAYIYIFYTTLLSFPGTSFTSKVYTQWKWAMQPRKEPERAARSGKKTRLFPVLRFSV